MRDYSDCYAVLGVTPDTDWETLRARYRRIIGQWHPDRFSADASGRDIAEERSKQITIAYQLLERYRREHGVLPRIEPVAKAASRQNLDRTADPVPHRAGPGKRAESGSPKNSFGEGETPRPRRRWTLAITLFVLVAAPCAAYLYRDVWMSNYDPPAQSAPETDTAKRAPVPAKVPRETPVFSFGSTLGDVYAIQGVPSRAEGDLWHYGKSKIRFSQGKVASWEEHPDNPLRVARERREGYFRAGSTKDEVRNVQGAPIVETDTVWDYGPSRVYFEHNRVVRWEESPMQPLRVPR